MTPAATTQSVTKLIAPLGIIYKLTSMTYKERVTHVRGLINIYVHNLITSEICYAHPYNTNPAVCSNHNVNSYLHPSIRRPLLNECIQRVGIW